MSNIKRQDIVNHKTRKIEKNEEVERSIKSSKKSDTFKQSDRKSG